jgi:hypothetical protein
MVENAMPSMSVSVEMSFVLLLLLLDLLVCHHRGVVAS